MNKLLSLVFVLGIFCATTAHAMPVALLGSAQAGVIHVGYRCGIGILGVPYHGCTPAYVPGGHCRGYHDTHHNFPFVRLSGRDGVIAVDKGGCGFGSYLACAYGGCWRRCY
jgi:hypothetical protein